MSQKDQIIERFQTRSGTGDIGFEYENLVVASTLLRLIDDNNIKNFKLSANDAEYGNFDDLVFTAFLSDGQEKKFAFQLKHRIKEKSLIPELKKLKGDFSLHEYFSSFSKLKTEKNTDIQSYKLVVFTNIGIDVCAFEGQVIQVDDLSVQIVEVPVDELISNCGKCYGFKVVNTNNNNKQKVAEMEDFFKNFYLCVGQENVNQMQVSVSEKFYELFKNTEAYIKFMNFIKIWNRTQGEKPKLDKRFMKLKIAELLLAPHIKILSSDKLSANLKLLSSTMKLFDVTIVDSITPKTCFQEIWKFQEIDKIKAVDEDIDLIFLKDFQELLFVELTEGNQEFIYKALNLCIDADNTSNFKFVLLGNILRKKLRNVSIFQDLSNLHPHHLNELKHIGDNFFCSLQGRKRVSIKDITDGDKESLKIFTIGRLLKFLDNNFRIGEPAEVLPEYYMGRWLSRALIKIEEYFKGPSKDCATIIFECNEAKIKLLKRLFYIAIHEFVDIEDFFSSTKRVIKPTIFYTKSKFSQKKIIELKKKVKGKKNYHCFHVTDEKCIEWIYSDFGIEDLQEIRFDPNLVPFQDRGFRGITGKDIVQPDTKEYFTSETHLVDNCTRNKITLICGSPGMGKSSVVKQLKNNLPSKVWVIKISIAEHSKYFQKKSGIDQTLKYLLTTTDSFAKSLIDLYKMKKKLIFLWDGLDEISDYENLQNVITNILELSNSGFVQLITSRTNIQPVLEEKFNVLAIKIMKFSVQDQLDFFKRRLRSQCGSNEEFQNIYVKFKEQLIVNSHLSVILEIPLQCYMLTELFCQDMKKYTDLLLDRIFSLTNLFYHFVDLKFNFQFKKQQIDCKDSMEEIKESRIENYKKVALRSCFDLDISEKFKIAISEKFLETLKVKGDRFGFITDVSDKGVVSFVHSTYGEYFAALYLAENYKQIPDLKSFIFQDKYENVRNLFDLILAKDCILHTAALCSNYDAVIEHLDDDDLVKMKDKGGRNLLHILSSCGTKHPLLKLTLFNKKTNYYISNQYICQVVREDEGYDEVINKLLDKCNGEDLDDVYGFNCFAYADKTWSLAAINRLLAKFKFRPQNFENFINFNTLAFYIAQQKYTNLVKVIEALMPQMEINTRRDFLGESLLHMACRGGSYFLAKLLVEKGADVNLQSVGNGHTPLRLASYLGNLEIVKYLIQKGADVNNSSHVDKVTPLIVACEYGHLEVVKYYVQHGARINVTNNDGLTPIYFACMRGFFDIVKYLYDKKANIHTQADYGFTCVYIASEKGNMDILRFLIKKGGKVNAAQNDGYTPLMIACENNRLEAMELLVDNGADLHAVLEQSKNNVLFSACRQRNFQSVKFLVDKGVNVNARNVLRATPLVLAVFNGNFDVIKYLVENKADVNVVTAEGLSPLSVACAIRDYYGVKFLIKNGAVPRLIRFGVAYYFELKLNVFQMVYLMNS